MTRVFIVSGPPGSGKTFFANGFAESFVKDGERGVLLSVDHFHCPTLMEHLPGEGYQGILFDLLNDASVNQALDNYQFDPDNLATGHPRCFKAFIQWMTMWKVNPFNIIVDNTNIHEGEIAPYYLAAQAFGAEVEILRVVATLDVCIKRGIHGVPDETIERMHTTFHETKDHPREESVRIPKQHMPWWVSRTV